ncbi:hypothetical protein NOX82_01430 [Pseudomonas citronellolis]|uniref:hypothetical protein n=1 Tax=Pseudomonas citronellolis TaxID=53408 RepID=UPI0021133A2C|nr:hypothetical protein [Pseudomonas citronellolis]UUC50620.1 hypothetical protein NOX82_01430 [Pseudomonas citronellolis]
MRRAEVHDKVLHHIRSMEASLNGAKESLCSLNSRKLGLEQELLLQMRKIAALQMAGDVDIDRQVQALLEQRRQAGEELQGEQRELDGQSQASDQEVIAAVQAIETMEADINQSLAQHVEYLDATERLARAQDALRKRVADHAEIAQECETKLKEFSTAPLYLYLKDRAYPSGPLYKPNFLTRCLDAWIARLCDYQNNQAKEIALQGLQKLNDSELKSHQYDVKGQEARLENLFKTKAADTDLKEARQRLQQAQSRQVQLQDKSRELARKLSLFAENKDPSAKAVQNLLLEALEQTDSDTLLQRASQTPGEEDDAAAARIKVIRSQLAELEERQKELKSAIKQGEKDYSQSLDLLASIQSDWLSATPGSAFRPEHSEGAVSSFISGVGMVLGVLADLSSTGGGGHSGGYGNHSSSSGSRSSTSAGGSSSGGGGFSSSSSSGGGGFRTTDSF